MQRDAISLDDLARRDNLVLATWKAARGKHHRPAVARFLADLDPRLDALAADILEGRVPSGRFHRFVIHDPKRRVITAVCFADRVLHHAILNLATPRFERMLVDSSFACRPGKGVHAAIDAVQRNLRRWPWLVRVDVDGYFASIDHERLKELLARRFKGAGLLALLDRIIDRGAADTPGRGLPIGALTSQHFANAYLDVADRMLLSDPGVTAHVRYMDDILWWAASKAAALETLAAFRDFLCRERRLRLKPAALVARCEHGLAFCGFRVRPGVVLASRRKLARYRAGLGRIEAARAVGLATEAAEQRAHDGLLATLAATQSLHFRRRLCGALDDEAGLD
ncbi:MAG: reverse transcriptase/maturase family protein, partial [Thauera sp.]